MSTYLEIAYIIGQRVVPLFVIALLLDEAYKVAARRRAARSAEFVTFVEDYR